MEIKWTNLVTKVVLPICTIKEIYTFLLLANLRYLIFTCKCKELKINPFMPGIVFWKPTPRVSASLGHTGHLPNRSFSVFGPTCSAHFALHSEKAHCSVACGSIHASTFLLPGLQMGPIVKLVIFMQIWPFHFLTTHKGQSPYIQEPG